MSTGQGKSLIGQVGWQATLLDVWCAGEEQNGRDVSFVRDVQRRLRDLSDALEVSEDVAALEALRRDLTLHKESAQVSCDVRDAAMFIASRLRDGIANLPTSLPVAETDSDGNVRCAAAKHAYQHGAFVAFKMAKELIA